MFSTSNAAPEKWNFTVSKEAQVIDDTLAVISEAFNKAEGLQYTFSDVVDMEAYGAILKGETFYSKHWNVNIKTVIVRDLECPDTAAAWVGTNQDDPAFWVAKIRICSGFFTYTHVERQVQTLAHEIVHAINGPDECMPMLLSYWLNASHYRTFTFEEEYWKQNQCESYQEYLPPVEHDVSNGTVNKTEP